MTERERHTTASVNSAPRRRKDVDRSDSIDRRSTAAIDKRYFATSTDRHPAVTDKRYFATSTDRHPAVTRYFATSIDRHPAVTDKRYFATSTDRHPAVTDSDTSPRRQIATPLSPTIDAPQKMIAESQPTANFD